jgi:hypothetical protein
MNRRRIEHARTRASLRCESKSNAPRWISLAAVCLVLTAPIAARGQEQIVARSPDDVELASPPIAQPINAVAPPYATPADPIDPSDLERRGQNKRVVGAVLMALGGALTVAAIGMTVDVLANKPISCSGHEEHATCAPSPGVTESGYADIAAVFGQLAILAGIPVYVVGSVQRTRARRMQAQLSLQPLVSRTNAGALAMVGFRF